MLLHLNVGHLIWLGSSIQVCWRNFQSRSWWMARQRSRLVRLRGWHRRQTSFEKERITAVARYSVLAHSQHVRRMFLIGDLNDLFFTVHGYSCWYLLIHFHCSLILSPVIASNRSCLHSLASAGTQYPLYRGTWQLAVEAVHHSGGRPHGWNQQGSQQMNQHLFRETDEPKIDSEAWMDKLILHLYPWSPKTWTIYPSCWWWLRPQQRWSCWCYSCWLHSSGWFPTMPGCLLEVILGDTPMKRKKLMSLVDAYTCWCWSPCSLQRSWPLPSINPTWKTLLN